MLKLLKQKALRDIKDNKKLYAPLVLALIFGIFSGGIAANLSPQTNAGLFADMTIFFSAYSLTGADALAVFTLAAFSNIRVIFLIFICGFLVFTAPFTFVWISSLGFKIGFSTVFFVGSYGVGGVLLAVLMVWLPNLIFLPIVLSFAMLTIRSAGNIHKLKSGIRTKSEVYKLYIKKIQEFLFFAALGILCGGVEAFVLPVILRPVSVFFM